MVPTGRSSSTAFLRDEDGIAAVEFTLVLPLLLILYLGSASLVTATSASRDTSILAETLANLVSEQAPNVAMTDATITDIFNAATAVMSPFSTTNLQMTISNVEFVANASSSSGTGFDAKTRWTVTMSGGTLRTCGTTPLLNPVSSGTVPSSTTMPVGVYSAGFIIVADVSYAYTPAFGSFSFSFGSGAPSTSTFAYSIKRTSYMRPRQTDNIRYQSGQSASICSISSPQTS